MKNNIFFAFILFCSLSCTQTLPEGKPLSTKPDIFPDYMDITIPYNIAPLNFALNSPHKDAYALYSIGDEQLLLVKAKKGQFKISPSKWTQMLKNVTDKTINVTVYAQNGEWGRFDSFRMTITSEPIDSYIAYRLIDPGYELWNRMGIYQRNLESYTESAILENRMSGQNCMNCHSFRMQDPKTMLFHMRDKYAGTYIIKNNQIEKLNTKTDQTMSSLVYPSWHPSGKYVAFSVNQTAQSFHQNDPNRIEVFDSNSDVVVYDTEKHEILTTSSTFSEDSYETFPTFSPDGKKLYFCTASAMPMPQLFSELKYSLCAVSFDPDTRRFVSEVDTLYNAYTGGQSASYPRISPDGKFLMYTLSEYGSFMVWHKNADLYMINLSTGEHYPLDAINSKESDSYHSWSSNSHWVVFSSRRIDGLYTRPHFTYIDENGQAAKPFLLPQKETEYYNRLMKSYNIPEFITGKVETSARELAATAKNETGINLTFAGKDF